MWRRTMNLATWCLLTSAVSLYTASFFLPAFRVVVPRGRPASGGMPGYLVFKSAFSRRLPSWLANVGFASGVVLLAARRPRASAVAAVVGLLLALSAIPVKPVEGHLRQLAPGYWVWAAASAILLWACYSDRHAKRNY